VAGGATISLSVGAAGWGNNDLSTLTTNASFASGSFLGLDTTVASNFTESGSFSGGFGLNKTGTGTLVLTSTANNYTGGTLLTGGTLSFANNALPTLSSTSITFNGGTLQWATGNSQDISASLAPVTSGQTAAFNTNGNAVALGTAITGAGGLVKYGAGTLALAASNTYSGATVINGGTLQLGNGTNAGSIGNTSSINISSGAVLAFNSPGTVSINASAYTYSNPLIGGAGGITQLGPGRVILDNGTTNYAGSGAGAIYPTGPVAITGGTLELANHACYNASSVANNGTLQIDAWPNWGFHPVISGTGTLVLNGDIDFPVNNSNFTGTMIINSGASWVSLDTNGGSSPYGTMGMSSVYIGTGGASFCDLTLGNSAANALSGVPVVNFSSAAAAQAGLRLYGGIASVGGLVDSDNNGQVLDGYTNPSTLTIAPTSTYSFNGSMIDGSSAPLGIVVNGIGGTQVLSGSSIKYSGPTTITSGTLQLVSCTAFAGTGAFTNNSALVMEQDSGSWTFSTAMSGNGTMTKIGNGQLILTGSNGYTGATTIAAGTLAIGNGGTGATLASTTLSDSGTLVFNYNNTLSYAGSISGPGSLVKSGNGLLALSGGNSYTGGTTLTAGTLNFTAGALPSAVGGVVFNGGTLQWATGNSQDVSAAIAPIASGTTANFDTNNNNVTFATAISGSGSLTKYGAGALILTAANTYGGATTIYAGTVQLGNGVATGSLSSSAIPLGSGGTLAFNSPSTISLSSTVNAGGGSFIGGGGAGSGTILQMGPGLLTLSGTTTNGNPASDTGNINPANVVISGGTLELANLACWNAPILNNSTLQIDNYHDWGFEKAISGSGNVVIAAGSTPFYGATSTYTGTTTIVSGGNLILANNNGTSFASIASPVVLIGTGGTSSSSFYLSNGGAGSSANPTALTGNPVIVFNSSGGAQSATFDMHGSSATIRGLSDSDGSGLVQSGYGSPAAATLTISPSSTYSYNGAINAFSGVPAMSLAINGPGTQILAGNCTYSGSTSVSEGTLIVNGSLSSTGNVYLYGGTLSGSGSVGNVFLDGGATLSPGTIAGAGTLTVSSAALNSSGTLNYTLGSSGNVGLLKITGGLTIGSGVTFDVTPGTGWGNGTYELASFPSGSITDNSTSFSGWTVGGVGLSPSQYTFSINGGSLDVAISGIGATTVAGTWTNTASGTSSWSTAGNWAGSLIPTATNDTALFGSAVTSGTATITLDGSHTLSGLTFNNTAASYSITTGTGGNLTLVATSGAVTLANSGGSHSISASVALGSNLNVTTAAGSKLTISGPVTQINTGTSLGLNGSGTLALSGSDSYSGGTTVSSGTLDVNSAQALPTTGVLVVGRSGRVVLGNITGAAEMIAASPLTSESTSLAAVPALSSIDSSVAEQASSPAVQVSVPVGASPSGSPAAVPEPGTIMLLLVGAAALAAWRRRKGLGIRD
jgi:autotransporter-associated beta strand protein